MPLVRIKRFAQVTLPPEARKKFNLNEGDYLNVEATPNGILLKPVTVVERRHAWEQLFSAIDNVKPQGPKSRKTKRQQEEEIAEIIKDFRRESRKKSHAKSRP